MYINQVFGEHAAGIEFCEKYRMAWEWAERNTHLAYPRLQLFAWWFATSDWDDHVSGYSEWAERVVAQ